MKNQFLGLWGSGDMNLPQFTIVLECVRETFFLPRATKQEPKCPIDDKEYQNVSFECPCAFCYCSFGCPGCLSLLSFNVVHSRWEDSLVELAVRARIGRGSSSKQVVQSLVRLSLIVCYRTFLLVLSCVGRASGKEFYLVEFKVDVVQCT